MKAVAVTILIFLFNCCFGQTGSVQPFVSAFRNIETSPAVFSFSNELEVNNEGGHLQGVQQIRTNSGEYIILTGSSDTYSYYAVVKQGDKNEVIAVNKLMDKPFKHAGGFQVFQNYMAVGIEDNETKDKSKVCIYDISNPEATPAKPVSVIERSGEPYRSTAGCVGMTKFKDKALLVVGDWDTKNVDFYTCNFDKIGNENFELAYSFSTETVSKKGWSDSNWLPYQNINLFSFDEELYLIGLGQNGNNENVADLYRLTEDSGKFNFKKTATKGFDCEKETSFKAGAGVVLGEDEKPTVISCGYYIEKITYLNYFDGGKEKVQVFPGHAHNDYEHERPLFDALDCQFKSIEADVYSVGDSLFVAHDFDQIKPGRTLRQLYLEPLKKRIQKNNGSVYGNSEEIILFIDIKDDGLKTYKVLDKILEEYKSGLTVFENGLKKQGSILVVVSGNRPFEFMQSQAVRYAGYDGRLENLGSGISPTLMPLVSDNWTKHFSWDGNGKMPEEERLKLKLIAANAKNDGYILRFWGTPNQTPEQKKNVWQELWNADVGLIGADDLKSLREFFRKSK